MIKNTVRIINKNSNTFINIRNNNNNNINSSLRGGFSTIKRFNTTLNHNNNNNNNNNSNIQTPISINSTIINNNNNNNNSSNNKNNLINDLNVVKFSTISTPNSILDTLNENQSNQTNNVNNNNNNNNSNNNNFEKDDKFGTPNNQNNNKLDLDTSKLYVSKSTSELFFTFMILKVCSFNFISDNSQKFLNLFEKLGLSKPLNFFIKYSFFKQFCAGETIRETEIFTEKLNKLGIGTILDYAIEELAGSSEGFDSVAENICETIRVAAKNPTNSFSCVKFTGLVTPSVLEKMNTLVSNVTTNVSELPIESFNSPLDFYLNQSLKQANGEEQPLLTSKDIKEIKEFFNRMDKIFELCHQRSVPILVDAEQSYYQVAIHHLTMFYSVKYNKEKPILYNTYQMYLVNGMNVLKQHFELSSKKFNFKLGAKIVRGAYMVTESERSQRLSTENPILPTIQDTHKSYNTALDFLLNQIKSDPNSIGIMIASHNEDSINLGTKLIKQYKIDPTNPNIQFGQLFGMADFLSFNLVDQHQRIFKYVPFGPVEEVLPYLIRRMHENKGFIGSNSDKELFYLKKEIKRRLF
ncbi:hypothetical protein ACTFIZ_009796 [Dictyostelium cf. discoideum]